MTPIVIRATIKIAPVYTCATCGATARGDTMTLELNTIDPDAVKAAARRATAHNIPVGWATYGSDRQECPLHKT